MWYVINHYPKLDDITEFETQDDAAQFYEKNCIDKENNNCWGIMLERPIGFFD